MSQQYFNDQLNSNEILEKQKEFTSWFEIDLDNIGYNLDNIRKRVGVEVMPVVKNNAYGHGLLPITAYLVNQGIKWVMVAKLYEAELIKDHGFETDVVNMDVLFTEDQYRRVVEKEITQTIYTIDDAKKLGEAAKKCGKSAEVFVKVDTGLNRIGVRHTDAVELITKISELKHVDVNGIFSTFQQRPQEDKVMLERFLTVDDGLKARGIDISFKSMSSSDAVFHNPDGWLNMVRPGMSLYGVYPEAKDIESGLDLKQALECKARVEYVKWVEKGESVTYWGKYTAPERMKIGTLHIGFYDAIPREMANKGKILAEGKYKDSVGSVSLNHYLLDLSGTEVKKGDVVKVIGRTGENTLSKTASTAGWMVYSLMNHFNPYLPRTYYLDGNPVALTGKY